MNGFYNWSLKLRLLQFLCGHMLKIQALGSPICTAPQHHLAPSYICPFGQSCCRGLCCPLFPPADLHHLFPLLLTRHTCWQNARWQSWQEQWDEGWQSVGWPKGQRWEEIGRRVELKASCSKAGQEKH